MSQSDTRLTVIPAPQTWARGEGFSPTPAGREDVRLDGDPSLAPEHYRLDITPDGVLLTAGDDAGLAHGLTTLRQLAADSDSLPCGLIEDGPRFGWRGLLLDCGRHFMPVDVIKGVIDRLATYKFNVLHWHLTEDQGWRLEIPGYPGLTEVGAWRMGPDGERYGGYYTAADVAEVLAYAAERHIRVVPEIEMPGHAVAALAAYPELSCTGGPFEVETQWGIHEDVFCAGREETFTFLENVLTHVMTLFPGEFIHIGGDEVPKDRWRNCPRCQARIEAEGLSGEEELQSWFVARIEKFLASHGRRLIGWDEILEGDLAERTDRAVVQAWRGHEKATIAARAGLDVIVSPTSHAYLDYDPSKLNLARVFAFEPIPEELSEQDAAHILGGAVNLWTEYVPPERVDTMLFPRLMAMAEALWTADDDRDFFEFQGRWLAQAPVLAELGAVPGPEARPLKWQGTLKDGLGSMDIEVDEETRRAFAGHDLKVARDLVSLENRAFDPAARHEDMDLEGPGPELVGKETVPLTNHTLAMARLFVDDRPYGAPAVLEWTPNLAEGREPVLDKPVSRRHPGGGPLGLVDGMRGGRDHEDGRWSGFEGTDLSATLDLGRVRQVNTVSLRFLQDANAWILLPHVVKVAWSADGETWNDWKEQGHDVSDRVQDVVIREFPYDLGGVAARFLRIEAENFGELPAWHPGRGQPSWIFVDELVVR